MRLFLNILFTGLTCAATFVVPTSTVCLAGSSEAAVSASWLDAKNQQEWRLLSTAARWQDARKICRTAKMRLSSIDKLQDAQLNLLQVSAGQKALEASELIWSADSWTDSSGGRPTAVAMSLRNGENTSVDQDNQLPVLCVRDLPSR